SARVSHTRPHHALSRLFPYTTLFLSRELKEIFNQAMRHEFRDDVVRGMGFRGDIFGTFVTDNIGYIQSKREYYIGEEPIRTSDRRVGKEWGARGGRCEE